MGFHLSAFGEGHPQVKRGHDAAPLKHGLGGERLGQTRKTQG